MKKILCLVGLFASVAAIDLENRCWEVGAEWLIWRPCTGSYVYGLDRAGTTTAKDLVVKPTYDSGFRIFGATYTCDGCHCFWVDWTHLRTTDRVKQEVANAILFPVLDQFTGAAEASLKFRYDKVNVRAGRYISCYCDSLAWLFGGARYVNIEQSRCSEMDNTESCQHAKFRGGALEVGLGADIKEPCNLHIVGHFAGVMAIGERKLNQNIDENTSFVNSETACIPGVEFRIGLAYRNDFQCVRVNVEVGYQLDHYFNAMRLMSSFLETVTGPLTSTFDVGFAGPYLGVSVIF